LAPGIEFGNDHVGGRTTKEDTKKAQEESKKAYTAVTTSCTSCHNVFRVEEDSF